MASSETWRVEGAPGAAIDGKTFPNQEAAETAVRNMLEGGGPGPLTVVQVVKTEVSRFDSTTSITKTVL